jgi:hypothetical protein
MSPARAPPTDWGKFVQAHVDRDIFQAAADELPANDIHGLGTSGREASTKPPRGRTRRKTAPTPENRCSSGKAGVPETTYWCPGDGSTRLTSRATIAEVRLPGIFFNRSGGARPKPLEISNVAMPTSANLEKGAAMRFWISMSVAVVVAALLPTAACAQGFSSSGNVFGGQNFSNGSYTMKNVFGGYNYYSPSGGSPIVGIPSPMGGMSFGQHGYSTSNVFGGQNFYSPKGGFMSSTPNVFGGSNYSFGGYSTSNIMGGRNFYR